MYIEYIEKHKFHSVPSYRHRTVYTSAPMMIIKRKPLFRAGHRITCLTFYQNTAVNDDDEDVNDDDDDDSNGNDDDDESADDKDANDAIKTRKEAGLCRIYAVSLQ